MDHPIVVFRNAWANSLETAAVRDALARIDVLPAEAIVDLLEHAHERAQCIRRSAR
jgi:hypothetical protein